MTSYVLLKRNKKQTRVVSREGDVDFYTSKSGQWSVIGQWSVTRLRVRVVLKQAALVTTVRFFQ